MSNTKRPSYVGVDALGPLPTPRPPLSNGDEQQTNPGAPVDVGYLKAKLEEVASLQERKLRNSGWLRNVVATVAGTGVTIALFLVFVDNRVHAETDAGVKVHESRIVALEQQVPQLRTEVYEGRLDTQALYRAVMEKRPQQRLEHPPPAPALDGGAP